MAKLTTATRRTPDPKADHRDGYRLAITMLRELEASTDICDLCALDEFVTGRATPQDNIVLRYLEKCRERSASVEAGFCAILSDFVAESARLWDARMGEKTMRRTQINHGLSLSPQRNQRADLARAPGAGTDRDHDLGVTAASRAQAPLRRGFLVARPRRSTQARFISSG